MGWVLPLIVLFIIACESKPDEAKLLAREVIRTIYEKDYPSMYKQIYDELEKLYNSNKLTYKNAEPLCAKANEIQFKDYRKMREKFTQKAREKGVYEKYKNLMQKLSEMDCTYAPTTALWSRIDNLCGSLKLAEKRNDPVIADNAWYIFKKKFQKYYKQAYEIKDKCLALVD